MRLIFMFVVGGGMKGESLYFVGLLINILDFERVELTSVEGGRSVARGVRTRSILFLLDRRILDSDSCPVSLSSNSV